jgi:hypothetical protein
MCFEKNNFSGNVSENKNVSENVSGDSFTP